MDARQKKALIVSIAQECHTTTYHQHSHTHTAHLANDSRNVGAYNCPTSFKSPESRCNISSDMNLNPIACQESKADDGSSRYGNDISPLCRTSMSCCKTCTFTAPTAITLYQLPTMQSYREKGGELVSFCNRCANIIGKFHALSRASIPESFEFTAQHVDYTTNLIITLINELFDASISGLQLSIMDNAYPTCSCCLTNLADSRRGAYPCSFMKLLSPFTAALRAYLSWVKMSEKYWQLQNTVGVDSISTFDLWFSKKDQDMKESSMTSTRTSVDAADRKLTSSEDLKRLHFARITIFEGMLSLRRALDTIIFAVDQITALLDHQERLDLQAIADLDEQSGFSKTRLITSIFRTPVPSQVSRDFKQIAAELKVSFSILTGDVLECTDKVRMIVFHLLHVTSQIL